MVVAKESSTAGTIDLGFEFEVLQKLSRIEAKMEMLAGNGQPGRLTLAENRLTELERNDIRRTVIERFVNASIALVVSVAIALRGHWWK